MIDNFDRTSRLQVDGQRDNMIMDYMQKCVDDYIDLCGSFNDVELSLVSQMVQSHKDILGLQMQSVFFEFFRKFIGNCEIVIYNIQKCQKYHDEVQTVKSMEMV